MAAGNWVFPDDVRPLLLDNDSFDIDAGSYKCALFLSTSNIGTGSTTYAALTNEVANANGYATGGIAVVFTVTGTVSAKATFASNPLWTAAGGSITARFAVIYEVAGNVLCYCLLDSTPADVTATDTNTFTVAAHANGIFTLA
jgi:hypothetical protein